MTETRPMALHYLKEGLAAGFLFKSHFCHWLVFVITNIIPKNKAEIDINEKKKKTIKKTKIRKIPLGRILRDEHYE